MTFSIIGFGRFGQLWAQALSSFGEIYVYNQTSVPTTSNPKIHPVTLAEAAQADIIFLCVPISQFEQCCQDIKPLLNPNGLIVDCCSVKIYPTQVMQKIFAPTQSLIGTHPLFGPDSVQRTGSLNNHKIVVCPIHCDPQKENQLLDIFQKLQLHTIITTADEHDKQMANSQGLIHFIGRGLTMLNLPEQDLATPDYQALLHITNMVVNDSWQLFIDMQTYNPYAMTLRHKFLQQLNKIDQQINEEKNHDYT
jgi:prephenate dehydrogenase